MTLTHTPKSKAGLLSLTLGSIGVVYGDIGTSPLYAFKESLAAANRGGVVEPMAVMGILSLIAWALIVIVTLKYVVLLLRADNHGEGGILSLMALVKQTMGKKATWIVMLGIMGAAMFYGDAIITPAISVLSAVEGLKLVTHRVDHYVIPIALVIIVALFCLQRSGTEKIAWCFGPIMGVWFVLLALGGAMHIAEYPRVWEAINPYHAYDFLTHHGFAALITLGAIFLSVTGAEALYADLGHFGKRPIRVAWGYVVMPALMLNYFGQGALVLAHPEALGDPFYLLYPNWALLPMVLISTLATVIASQAVITGAFSVTHQAIQLGLLPRFNIRYTSAENAGQIYLPQVNWLLLGGVILLIATFRTSSNLASAYGIAVTGTMIITDILTLILIRRKWRWPLYVASAAMAPLLAIDLIFLQSNMVKVFEGGFIPLLVSGLLVLMMHTWICGTRILLHQLHNKEHTFATLIEELSKEVHDRVAGTAIYLNGDTSYLPSAIRQNLKHYHVLHEQNLLMRIRFLNEPFVEDKNRVRIEPICKDFTQVTMSFGFMEPPNIPKALHLVQGLPIDLEETTFFISRSHILPSATFGMPLWKDRIFIAMANNAGDPAEYFSLPLDRVVELGVQLKV